MKQRREHIAREAELDNTYNRASVNDYTKCIYCGADSRGWDHVPALFAIEKGQHTSAERLLVPACKACNLSASTFGATITERRRAMHARAKATARQLRKEAKQVERRAAMLAAHLNEPEPRPTAQQLGLAL